MVSSEVILEEISAYEGCAKSRVRWMPALRMMEESVGWALVILWSGVNTPLSWSLSVSLSLSCVRVPRNK